MQLYRCEWLNEIQRSNILVALNAMSEKSSFMGVSDLPMVRTIETVPPETTGEQHQHSTAKTADQRQQVTRHSSMVTSASSTSSTYIHSSEAAVASAVAHFEAGSDRRVSTTMAFLNRPANAFIDNKHDTRIVNEAFQVSAHR